MRKPLFAILPVSILLVCVLYAAWELKVFTAASPDSPNIAVVLKSLNVRSDFWQTVNAGAQVAARQYGAAIELAGPLQEGDADAQLEALEEAVARKPAAIVLAPFNHDRMPEIVHRIREAGIRLVLIDTPLNIAPAPVFVGNDHREAGRLAGLQAAKITGGKPVAAVLAGSRFSSVSEQRLAGAKEGLSAYHGFRHAAFDSDGQEESAYAIALSLLREQPNFNVFIALSAEATQGAARAIRESAADDRVRLIGFDSTLEEIQLLEAGVLDAAIVQKPFNMGYLGVKTALGLLSGGKQQDIDIASTLVTRDNMYTPEIQKLLFPFIENQ